MHFIILFGPPAVGKMSVGLEIEHASGIKLFHNHATIELVLNFFPFGDPAFTRLVDNFRMQILREVANSDLPGLTFTYVWDLDSEDDRAFVASACKVFDEVGAQVSLVELTSNLEQRLIRNRSLARLQAKPSKRNVAESEKHLLQLDKDLRLNSMGRKLPSPYRHVLIDNSNLSAQQTAELILKQLEISTSGAK